jgi:transposase
MRMVREALRLREECGRSQREIQAATGLSKGSVTSYLLRAKSVGLTWALARELNESELEARLYGQRATPTATHAPVDFEWVHSSLRCGDSSLKTLWEAYRVAADTQGDLKPYHYSRFCDLYASWRATLGLAMSQTHRAGEKAFVEYADDKPSYIAPTSGEPVHLELFVMVMGASCYTYAEVAPSQSPEEFAASVERGLKYFTAVPAVVVPSLRNGQWPWPTYRDGEPNSTHLDLAEQYGIAIVPARARKRLKEPGVRIALRWIMRRLRRCRPSSIGELELAVAHAVEDLNTRRFARINGTRRSAFEAIDRPAMRPLVKQCARDSRVSDLAPASDRIQTAAVLRSTDAQHRDFALLADAS